MIRVTDHAVQRLFERGAHTDLLEELCECGSPIKDAISARLGRAWVAAMKLGLTDYHVTLDGLRFIIRDSVVITVVTSREERWARKNGIARPHEAAAR